MPANVDGSIPSRDVLEILRPPMLDPLHPPRAIAIVGGTCAGKSTLARALSSSVALTGICAISSRVTTRAPRNDDASDNVLSVDLATFEALARDGVFALAWQRPVSGHDPIWYGCTPAQSPVAIHLAGHGLYTNSGSISPSNALAGTLLVGVTAPVATRRARLRERSPDIVASGMGEALLAHDDDLMRAHVDVLVHNHGPHELRAAAELTRFIAGLVSPYLVTPAADVP